MGEAVNGFLELRNCIISPGEHPLVLQVNILRLVFPAMCISFLVKLFSRVALKNSMHSESVSNIQAYLAKLRCLFMTRRGGRRDVNV